MNNHLFKRLVLLDDNSAIGIVNEEHSGVRSVSEQPREAKVPLPTCVAFILEPSGARFSVMQRDGSIISHLTSCCKWQYIKFMRELLMFRNAMVTDVPPYVCQNLCCCREVPTHIESFEVRWPKHEDDCQICFSDRDLIVATNGRLWDSYNNKFDHADFHDCPIICYADGSVDVVGHINNDEECILTLFPTGHFVRVSYLMVVTPMDSTITFQSELEKVQLATRVVQVFSSLSIPKYFYHALQLAQSFQKKFRQNVSTRKHQPNQNVEIDLTGYVSFRLPNCAVSYVSVTEGNTKKDYERLLFSEFLPISSCSKDASRSSFFSLKGIKAEWNEDILLQSMGISRKNSICRYDSVAAHLHFDASCLVLDGLGNLFHHYRIERGNKEYPFQFRENIYHKDAVEFIDVEFGGGQNYCLQTFTKKMISYRRQLPRSQVSNTVMKTPREKTDLLNLSSFNKQEIHENDTGVYTKLLSGQIHVLFRDRTIFDTHVFSCSATIIFRNALKEEVDMTKPSAEAKIYVKLVKEFIKWVSSSPLERQKVYDENIERMRLIRRRNLSTNAFLAITSKMGTLCHNPLGSTDANDVIQETETLRRQINLLLKPAINRT